MTIPTDSPTVVDLLTEIRDLLGKSLEANRSARSASAPVDGDERDTARDAEPVRGAIDAEYLAKGLTRVVQALCEGRDILVLTEPDLVAAVDKLLSHGSLDSSGCGDSEGTARQRTSIPAAPFTDADVAEWRAHIFAHFNQFANGSQQ